jgi:predicted enzyme related to lactoylglutathione lyase
MDVMKTPGAFSWSELMTTDPKAAVAFYGQLFGWQSKDMDMGTGAYHVQNVGETSVAGIMGMPPGAQGMPPMWGCYVTVANVDETLKKAEALGGKVMMPAMDVAGVGRMAVIADPQGATLNVITYAANA